MKYNGRTLYKELNFNLYGEEVAFNNSKESILRAFKSEYETIISMDLQLAGLELVKLEYYSPKFYNYEGDSIDPEIEVVDQAKLDTYIKNNTAGIQALLDANKSYDGYIALTPDTVEDINNDELMIVIQHIFNGIDFSDFDIYDHMIPYDEPDEEEITEYMELHNADESGEDSQWTYEDAEYHLLLSDEYNNQ